MKVSEIIEYLSETSEKFRFRKDRLNALSHLLQERKYKVDIEKLKESRFKVQIPLAPAIAFGGKCVVFLDSLSVGLIEIVEE